MISIDATQSCSDYTYYTEPFIYDMWHGTTAYCYHFVDPEDRSRMHSRSGYMCGDKQKPPDFLSFPQLAPVVQDKIKEFKFCASTSGETYLNKTVTPVKS